KVFGVVHRTEHAVTMRDQLRTKRRRPLDEIFLSRHGRSPIWAWTVLQYRDARAAKFIGRRRFGGDESGRRVVSELVKELTEKASTNMNQPMNTQIDGLAGTTAIVTGASRGFGRAIATALSAAGAEVVGVARTGALLDEVRSELGDSFIPVVADAADPAT